MPCVPRGYEWQSAKQPAWLRENTAPAHVTPRWTADTFKIILALERPEARPTPRVEGWVTPQRHAVCPAPLLWPRPCPGGWWRQGSRRYSGSARSASGCRDQECSHQAPGQGSALHCLHPPSPGSGKTWWALFPSSFPWCSRLGVRQTLAIGLVLVGWPFWCCWEG